MEIQHERCAGMDVSKRDVKVCVRTPGKRHRTFNKQITVWGATAGEVRSLTEYLVAQEVTLVVMEATGSYWKPFYYPMEAKLNVMLVNARHAKYPEPRQALATRRPRQKCVLQRPPGHAASRLTARLRRSHQPEPLDQHVHLQLHRQGCEGFQFSLVQARVECCGAVGREQHPVVESPGIPNSGGDALVGEAAHHHHCVDVDAAEQQIERGREEAGCPRLVDHDVGGGQRLEHRGAPGASAQPLVNDPGSRTVRPGAEMALPALSVKTNWEQRMTGRSAALVAVIRALIFGTIASSGAHGEPCLA